MFLSSGIQDCDAVVVLDSDPHWLYSVIANTSKWAGVSITVT